MPTHQITSIPERVVANMCFGPALAVVNVAAFNTTGTPAVSVDGTTFALTAQTGTALAALTAANLPASQANWVQPSGLTGFYSHPTAASLGVSSVTVYYVVGVIAAGTWLVVQGTYDGQQLSNTAGGYGVVGKSIIPDVPDGFTPVFVIKLVTTAAFVPATTTMASISTFKNVSVLPVAKTF